MASPRLGVKVALKCVNYGHWESQFGTPRISSRPHTVELCHAAWPMLLAKCTACGAHCVMAAMRQKVQICRNLRKSGNIDQLRGKMYISATDNALILNTKQHVTCVSARGHCAIQKQDKQLQLRPAARYSVYTSRNSPQSRNCRISCCFCVMAHYH